MLRIMLDPGHAGSYYNASPVVKGYYESNMTWDLTQLLKKELEAYGIEVGLTRSSKNEDPELVRRGQSARGYDLFISIHSNAATNESADAPWIIHFSNDSKTSIDEKSKEFAHIIGPVVSSTMNVSDPYYCVKAVDFDRDGNGYKDDEYYGVLFGAKNVGVPGIIIEHSFHTNRYAATWLLDSKNLELLARNEAKAIADYFGITKETEMTAQERLEFEQLQEKVRQLETNINNSKVKYNWTLSCPEWAQSTVHKLHQKKILQGNEKGELRLSEDMCRILVMLDRAKVFD